jgi:methylenetetrahydrofolate reductase (NADPH)
MDNHHLSFEFFPPKTEEGKLKLAKVHAKLKSLNPEFFSVTYGAGGSTKTFTKDTVLDIQKKGSNAVPHVSVCADDTPSLFELLNEYKSAGISKIVALRGDLPSGVGGTKQLVYANELVKLIKDHFGDSFEIFVAAYPEIHPESESYQKDIYWLNKKFEAGASRGITQYFYNSNSYLYFVEQCKKSGIEAPIIPGIMPITNYHNLVRFSENCGADIPRWIQKRLHQYSDDTESIKDFGLDVVTHLCEELLENNAPGLHFYTMNQADVNLTLCNRLGFSLANA